MRFASPALLAVSLLTGACAGVADFAPEAAGLGAGAGAGVLTANPLVGVAVAIVTRFAAAEAVGYVEGEQQTRVQHAIAASGGAASINEVATWATEEDPWFDALFGRVGGRLEVVREFGSLIICRELLYTVADPRGGVEGTFDTVEQDVTPAASPAPTSSSEIGVAWPGAGTGPVLAAVICNAGEGWRWAVSRPATEATW
jgi:hypothetical protein